MRTAGYVCGWPKQDIKHLLLFYPKLNDERRELVGRVGTRDIEKILTQPQGIREAARWVIGTGWSQ